MSIQYLAQTACVYWHNLMIYTDNILSIKIEYFYEMHFFLFDVYVHNSTGLYQRIYEYM